MLQSSASDRCEGIKPNTSAGARQFELKVCCSIPVRSPGSLPDRCAAVSSAWRHRPRASPTASPSSSACRSTRSTPGPRLRPPWLQWTPVSSSEQIPEPQRSGGNDRHSTAARLRRRPAAASARRPAQTAAAQEGQPVARQPMAPPPKASHRVLVTRYRQLRKPPTVLRYTDLPLCQRLQHITGSV